jgi:hypothetical protein
MLSKEEWLKLRDVINAWPDDSDRIRLHRVINRELDPKAGVTWNETSTTERVMPAASGGSNEEARNPSRSHDS